MQETREKSPRQREQHMLRSYKEWARSEDEGEEDAAGPRSHRLCEPWLTHGQAGQRGQESKSKG